MESTDREALISAMIAPDGPFPVGTADVRGVKLRVYENAPNDLREVFFGATQFGDQRAITYEYERFTWDQYLDVVARFARILSSRLDVRPGDRVALAMRNYPEWLFTFAASVSLGAVSVPLNAWWSATELQYAIADCGATVFVGDAERVQRVQSKRLDIPSLKHVIEVRPGKERRGDADWSELLAAEALGAGPPSVAINTDDDCTIMYTSGTTGQPKGAVASHRAHASNLFNMLFSGALEGELTRRRGDDVQPAGGLPTALIAAPLFHVSGLPWSYMSAALGIHVVLMYKWDADRAIDLIEKERVNSAGGVPTVVRELLDAAERSGRDISSLRTVVTGGAQSSSQLVRRIGSQFRNSVGTGTGYGLTETTGPMVGIGSHDYFERPRAVGRPYPTSEVRVVDDEGSDVVDGEPGESWFKGPNIARGYWNQDNEAFRPDGWFRSGDLVRRDEDGFIYIVDRIKDIVIRAGENVFCSEVEDALFGHPAVREVSVFGVPHELWGEEVVATVQVSPGQSVSSEGLRDFVRTHLSHYKIPTAFAIGAEPLPRNAAGKVLKRELRSRWLGARPSEDDNNNFSLG